MRAAWFLLAVVVVGLVVWMSRFELVGAGPAAYRLDRWTGNVDFVRGVEIQRARAAFDAAKPFEVVPAMSEK